jgi:hypothetical protein
VGYQYSFVAAIAIQFTKTETVWPQFPILNSVLIRGLSQYYMQRNQPQLATRRGVLYALEKVARQRLNGKQRCAMAQVQNNVTRFAGPSMIQDSHHMSGIPQVQDDSQGVRQSDQGQSEGRQQGSENRRSQFEYENPRQYS